MTARAAPRGRDARIDLARGLTMLIIFIAHVPGNGWASYIPAKMGFSSGAEAFVLCSGLACGIAFDRVFRERGWGAGTLRIGRRIGQLWLAQVLCFIGFAALLLGLDAWLGGTTYRDCYDLGWVAGAPVDAIAGLMRLAYVPDYFDILPLYIVVLALVPIAVALARRSPGLALACSGALWLVVQIAPLNLSAHPISGRPWFFDPLAWQFLFFIGYGVTAGWFRPPTASPVRIALALAIVVGSIPLTFWGAHEFWPALRDLYVRLQPTDAISTLHPLRLLHVLALGWLFAVLLAPFRTSLFDGAARPVLLVGQQSLSTFLAGIILAALAGAALDAAGRDPVSTAVVNLMGGLLLIAVAVTARAVKAALKDRSSRKEWSACRSQS